MKKNLLRPNTIFAVCCSLLSALYISNGHAVKLTCPAKMSMSAGVRDGSITSYTVSGTLRVSETDKKPYALGEKKLNFLNSDKDNPSNWNLANVSINSGVFQCNYMNPAKNRNIILQTIPMMRPIGTFCQIIQGGFDCSVYPSDYQI